MAETDFAASLTAARKAALQGNYSSSIPAFHRAISLATSRLSLLNGAAHAREQSTILQLKLELQCVEELQALPSILTKTGEPRRMPAGWPSPAKQRFTSPPSEREPTRRSGRKAGLAKHPRSSGRKRGVGRGRRHVSGRMGAGERKEDEGSAAGSFSAMKSDSADLHIIEDLESSLLSKSLNVSMADIAGAEDAKDLLEEAIVFPTLHPAYFTGIKKPWKGILLFGPPGTGKTMLAKAIASECKHAFFNVSTSTFSSKWRGESEKTVRILFEMARFYAPSIIFIDEIDSIGSSRGGSSEHEASRRVKSELLMQMDGISSSAADASDAVAQRVVILAATNFPWDLDEALRRRLEKRIYVPLPDFDARVNLFSHLTKEESLTADVDFETLARKTEGYSGADIRNVCRHALMEPMRRLASDAREAVRLQGGGRDARHRYIEQAGKNGGGIASISMDFFLSAIAKNKKSVGSKDLKKYEQWMEEFGAS